MEDYQRKALLEELEKFSRTVGRRIPETICIEGEELAIRDVVFKFKTTDLTEADEERLAELRRAFRRRRIALVDVIEDGEVSYEEGQEVLDKVNDVDRVIEALDAVSDATSFADDAQRSEVADARRWQDFVNTIRPP